MRKEDKIKEAYGEYKGKIDENGWTNFMVLSFFKKDMLDSKVKVNSLIYRPKSLQGIETNNGWVKIESESDLPKESNRLWIIFNGMIGDCFYNYSDKVFWNTYNDKPFIDVTHYQIIKKPNPPIY